MAKKKTDAQKAKARRQKYAVDQHDLICQELRVGKSPRDPGDTCFEAVMRIQNERDQLREMLDKVLASFGPMIDLFDDIRNLKR